MISGVAEPGAIFAVRLRAPAPVLLVSTLYAVFLVALGSAMLLFEPAGAMLEIFPLCAAFFPAALTLVAVYRYGHALFRPEEAAQRRCAWLRLLRISAIFCSLIPIETILFAVIYDLFYRSATVTIRPQDINFRDFEGVIIGAIAFANEWWTTLAATAGTVLLVWIWVLACKTAFLSETTSNFETEMRHRQQLPVALLAGGVMVLCSLALQVSYSTAGWEVLLWKGRWLTNEFVTPYSLAPWVESIMFAGYVAGIVLAVMALISGVALLCGKALSPTSQKRLMGLSAVVLWFALTSYWGDCLYMSLVGILHPEGGWEFVWVTAMWLAMFLAGVVLWFRFAHRTDNRAGMIRTALLLWMLPLMALTLGTFWYAAAWELFGLVLFMAGVEIVAACSWKIAHDASLQSKHA